jgi:hypothetical protein
MLTVVYLILICLTGQHNVGNFGSEIHSNRGHPDNVDIFLLIIGHLIGVEIVVESFGFTQ